MTAPADDPDSYPAAFDVYVGPVGTPLPGNAVDALDSALVLVGQVDGKTLYSYGGLGKGVNPFPVTWTTGPTGPFAYGTTCAVVYQGAPPVGGHMRVCLAQVSYADGGAGHATGTAVADTAGVPSYWYYEPAAS